MAISPITIGSTPVPAAGGCGCGGCGCGADEASGAVQDQSTPATAEAPTAFVDTAAVVAAAEAAPTVYAVEGMTCGHCVSSVTEEISALPGVTEVQVELVVDGRSTVSVQSTEPLDDADVRAAIDEAGYQLVGRA